MRPTTICAVASLLCCLCGVSYAGGKLSFNQLNSPLTRFGNSSGNTDDLRSGCVDADALMLPAILGDAGTSELFRADGLGKACAFRIVDTGTRAFGFTALSGEQPASITPKPQFDGRRAATTSASSQGNGSFANDKARETTLVTSAPLQLTLSEFRTPTPNHLNHILRVSAVRTMPRNVSHRPYPPSSANSQSPLILSATILIVALLVVLGTGAKFAYLRWFSEGATLARAVHRGLRRNEFSLEYQPVFYTRTRKCIGLELVVRWKNGEYGLRGETWFMEKLADHRSAAKLAAFALSTAERELGFLKMGRRLSLMVNLWASYLRSDECIAMVTTSAKSFASGQLVFQVKAEDLHDGLSTVERLQQDNIRVALSGMRASTARTAALPVDFEFLKIDREVMALDDAERLWTLRTIAAIGRELDVAVIADGVEGIAQSQALRDAQIELAQGFFFGKATPANQLSALLQRTEQATTFHLPA